jgi:tetratricopeptide (TPR) repeat protein
VCLLFALAVLSQSVSAIAGLAVAMWLAALVGDRARRRWWIGGGAAGVVAMLGLAAWKLGGPQAALQKLAAASRPAPGVAHAAFGVESRFEIWERSLRIIHDMPYTGSGPATFSWVMDRFYPGFALGPQPHAHNLFLEAGVDFGLIGLVAYVWLLAGLAFGLVSVYRTRSGREVGLAALGLGAGLLAYLIFGLIDVITLGSRPGLLFWIVLGLSASLLKKSPSRAPRRVLGAAMLALAIAVLLLPLRWAGPQLNAGRVFAGRALLAAANGETPINVDADLRRAVPALQVAAARDPANAGTWYLLSETLARLGQNSAALDALEHGVMVDSKDPLVRYAALRGLARAESRTDWAGLQSVYGQWMVRYPRTSEWYAAAAVAACLEKGNSPEAANLLSAGLNAGAQPAGLLQEAQQQLARCA